MNYLSEMLKLPVVDAAGEKIGIVNDLGIATGEVFPRVTALAFQGPGKTPFMISWRKYVERFDDVALIFCQNAHITTQTRSTGRCAYYSSCLDKDL